VTPIGSTPRGGGGMRSPPDDPTLSVWVKSDSSPGEDEISGQGVDTGAFLPTCVRFVSPWYPCDRLRVEGDMHSCPRFAWHVRRQCGVHPSPMRWTVRPALM